jgi:ATP-dependent Lon protease
VSAITGIPVRADVAMTGEITLRGEVLAIGGLKEKLLAAHRGGVKTVMIPQENVKDLAEIPDNIKNRLEIVPVKWIDKVLEVALERQPVPLTEEEAAAAHRSSRPLRPDLPRLSSTDEMRGRASDRASIRSGTSATCCLKSRSFA